MGLRQPGEVLGGRYRLIRPLGQGGMGSVWHAEHLTLNASVALKLIETPANPAPAVTERFLREARLAAALRSPHVVQIFDYGVEGNTPYIAMELLEGESLAVRLERVGRLSARETTRVVQHVARAIGRAHDSGVIHRDLKPENVFIVRNDDEEIFKVLDFGIAKAHGSFAGPPGTATRTGSLLGTPSYMSPEQAEGAKAIDHRTDIWALGVIAYRCLLGRLPFSETSVGQMILAICTRPLPVPSSQGPVPEGFDAWFAHICARAPEQRFDSARLAAVELCALLGDDASLTEDTPSPAPPPSPPALHSTTSQVSNSEVISRRGKTNGTKRVAAPIAIAAVLALGALAVSRITASLQRQQAAQSSVAASELEQLTLGLAARPEPAPGAASAGSLPIASPPPETVPAEALPAEALPTPAQYPDLPAGVRLTAGVHVVPSLPRLVAPSALEADSDTGPMPADAVLPESPAPRSGNHSTHRKRAGATDRRGTLPP